MQTMAFTRWFRHHHDVGEWANSLINSTVDSPYGGKATVERIQSMQVVAESGTDGDYNTPFIHFYVFVVAAIGPLPERNPEQRPQSRPEPVVTTSAR